MSKFFNQVGMDILNIALSMPYFIRTTYVTAYMSVFAGSLVKSLSLNDKSVKDYASDLANVYAGSYNMGQVGSIWDKINSNFIYTTANPFDFPRSVREQIINGMYGDCEDFAVLVAGLIKAIGGTVRIICGVSHSSGHVWTEVFVGNIDHAEKVADFIVNNFYAEDVLRYYIDSIHFHKDINNNYWLMLEQNTYLGKFDFKANYQVAVYPNGEYLEIYKG